MPCLFRMIWAMTVSRLSVATIPIKFSGAKLATFDHEVQYPKVVILAFITQNPSCEMRLKDIQGDSRRHLPHLFFR